MFERRESGQMESLSSMDMMHECHSVKLGNPRLGHWPVANIKGVGWFNAQLPSQLEHKNLKSSKCLKSMPPAFPIDML